MSWLGSAQLGASRHPSCSAAPLVPALATTAVALGVHLLLRPLGRLLDRAHTGKDEALAGYGITVTVRRKHELALRAQLLRALAEPAITVRGLTSRAEGDDTNATASGTASANGTAMVELGVDVLVESDPPRCWMRWSPGCISNLVFGRSPGAR